MATNGAETMPDLTAQAGGKMKPKGSAFLVVIEENSSSSAGPPLFESAESVKRSKYFYEPEPLNAVQGVYVTNAVQRRREEEQLELYETEP
jgi:hypothetical protein